MNNNLKERLIKYAKDKHIDIREETIENSVKILLSDKLEYNNVVNEMYDDNVLDDDDIEELNLNKEKNYLKEKI